MVMVTLKNLHVFAFQNMHWKCMHWKCVHWKYMHWNSNKLLDISNVFNLPCKLLFRSKNWNICIKITFPSVRIIVFFFIIIFFIEKLLEYLFRILFQDFIVKSVGHTHYIVTDDRRLNFRHFVYIKKYTNRIIF